MTIRYDNDQLFFLARLLKSPDGKALLDLLRARLQARDSELRDAPEGGVLQAQGRAKEVADLIGDIEGAQDKLERIRQTAAPRSRPVAYTGEGHAL